RLVEQPAGGAGDQQVREGEPLALAAADLPERGVAGQDLEAEPGEGLLGAALRVPDVGEGRLGQQAVVAGAGRWGPGPGLLPRRGQLPLEPPGALERVGEDIGERGAGAEGQLLAQQPDGPGHLAGAGVGAEIAGEDAQQGGLAAAVLAEQPG